MLLGYYNKFGKFDDSQRTQLVYAIARYFDENNIPMPLSLSYKFEQEILSAFPTEKLVFKKQIAEIL